MLETSNLARKYTPICSFRKYTFQCLGTIYFADVSIFCKNQRFCPKKYLYSKQQFQSCVREIFQLFFQFLQYKRLLLLKTQFLQTLCLESGLQIAPKWPKIRKMTKASQFSDMTSTSIVFDVILFLLSTLVTGQSFMSISSPVLELCQFSFIRD